MPGPSVDVAWRAVARGGAGPAAVFPLEGDHAGVHALSRPGHRVCGITAEEYGHWVVSLDMT